MPIDTIMPTFVLKNHGTLARNTIHGLEQQCNASIRSLGSMPRKASASKRVKGGGAIHQGNGGDLDDFFIMSIEVFFPFKSS